MSLPDLMTTYDGYGEYVIVDKTTVDDGFGGYSTKYVDGAHFMGVLTVDDNIEMKIAEAQGVKDVYKMTVDKSIRLPWHTVFRPVGDSRVYRVTTKDENATPERATIKLRVVSAEEWVIPDNE